MPETRSHHFVQELKHSPEVVFKALVTPSQIRTWWSAKRVIMIPEVGGFLCATWGDDEDDPEFISYARIKEFKENERLVLHDYNYTSKEGGLPFDADFETTFELHLVKNGVELAVDQTGFPMDPKADDYYEGCRTGWETTLTSLERFLRVQAL